MIYAVIDTNVLVSALLKKGSNPDKVINLIADKKVHPLYSEKILAEYREVLGRKKKYDFGAGIIDAVTDLFLTLGTSLEAGHPDSAEMAEVKDKNDIVFYEVTLEARNDTEAYLVTGNMKHFPARRFIVTPAEFLDIVDKASGI